MSVGVYDVGCFQTQLVHAKSNTITVLPKDAIASEKKNWLFTGNGCCTCNLKFSMSLTESEGGGWGGTLCEEDLDFPLNSNAGISFSRSLPDSQIDQGWDLKLYWVIFNQATALWKGQKQWNQHLFRFSFSIKMSCHHNTNIAVSGETLCRDNCQLIGIPYFHTRSAGKNNRN